MHKSKNNFKNIHNFLMIVKDITHNSMFITTKNFKHHGLRNTVYKHSLKTAYCAYLFCLHLSLSYNKTVSIVRAAMLHDFFGYDWTDPNNSVNLERKKLKGIKKLLRLHAFYHGYLASKNASNYFDLNNFQKEAIIKHMFPLYPIPPRHLEGWIVTISDKIIATQELLSIPKHYFKT